MTTTRFTAHATNVCDCGNLIGPGNFSGLCWDCLASLPALCGDCGKPVEGVTAADEQGGCFVCEQCLKTRDAQED